MKLDNIGFYTLSDNRVENTSMYSQLYRCELILTSRCNFQCLYCRGMTKKNQGDLDFKQAKNVLDLWSKEKLINVRFSGGEPTLWKHLLDLVKYARKNNVERIALSTNGSADLKYYLELIKCGVNDFSISLDSCCSATGDIMAGVEKSWKKVIENIKQLSKLTYVTAGVVLMEKNINEVNKIIEFASNELGVNDIRLITSAQTTQRIKNLNIKSGILNKHPILCYRYNNIQNGIDVRGIKKEDFHKCALVLDDVAVMGDYHYPCIIYLRERGKPIGKITSNVRKERYDWFQTHNCYKDKICKNNCLDVCIEYNNKYRELRCNGLHNMSCIKTTI